MYLPRPYCNNWLLEWAFLSSLGPGGSLQIPQNFKEPPGPKLLKNAHSSLLDTSILFLVKNFKG